jgi:hypothetical protein
MELEDGGGGGGGSQGPRVHARNKPENMNAFGPQSVPYFKVYSGASPVGPWALGLGASQGPRVHDRNKPENMNGFGPQSVPYFKVYSGARQVGLGAASFHRQYGGPQGVGSVSTCGLSGVVSRAPWEPPYRRWKRSFSCF